jgi:hypothetical protein
MLLHSSDGYIRASLFRIEEQGTSPIFAAGKIFPKKELDKALPVT